MTYVGAGGRGAPKSLVISNLRPLFLNLYIHCIIHVNLSSHYYNCILICLISIYYFPICNSLISLLFISGSLFHIYLFVIHLFRIILITIWYLFISHSLFRLYLFRLRSLVIKKKLPTLSSGERSVMRTTIYLRGKIFILLQKTHTLLCY